MDSQMMCRTNRKVRLYEIYGLAFFKNTIFINFCHSLNTIRGYTDHRIKEKNGTVQDGLRKSSREAEGRTDTGEMQPECIGPESI